MSASELSRQTGTKVTEILTALTFHLQRSVKVRDELGEEEVRWLAAKMNWHVKVVPREQGR